GPLRRERELQGLVGRAEQRPPGTGDGNRRRRAGGEAAREGGLTLVRRSRFDADWAVDNLYLNWHENRDLNGGLNYYVSAVAPGTLDHHGEHRLRPKWLPSGVETVNQRRELGRREGRSLHFGSAPREMRTPDL